jgi:hypothetical protein
MTKIKSASQILKDIAEHNNCESWRKFVLSQTDGEIERLTILAMNEHAAQFKPELPTKQQIVQALYEAAKHEVKPEGYTVIHEFEKAADAMIELFTNQPKEIVLINR